MKSQTIIDRFSISAAQKPLIDIVIATSRNFCYKMKIDNDHQCIKCFLGTTETWKHIYLECPENIGSFFFK